MQNVSWIFFDIGSTLVDESIAVGSRNRATVPLLRMLGFHANMGLLERLHREAGRKGAKNPFDYALGRIGCGPDDIRWIRGRARYDSRKERLYPGAKRLLADLSRRYRLGIIANQSRGLTKRLRRLGIAKHLKVIIGSADVGFDKPGLRIFRLALKRAGTTARRCIMVGDIPNKDIYPANRLGMTTIRVFQGFHRVYRPANRLETADHSFRRISQVRKFLLSSRKS